MTSDERSGRALWDLWLMLQRLREPLGEGFVIPPADLATWEDTVPVSRLSGEDEE